MTGIDLGDFIAYRDPVLTEEQAAWWPRLDPWAEPSLPIAEREQPLTGGCAEGCMYGTCSAPGSTLGCGGCCYCLNGCQDAYERAETAPHVWTGDPA